MQIIRTHYADSRVGNRRYRRNVANTVLTCFFTILTMTLLYACVWHKARDSYIITMSSERLVSYDTLLVDELMPGSEDSSMASSADRLRHNGAFSGGIL